ncbi:MAG: Txe/YoeB family addiction module toxin [Candidatus Peregrinibacteria bacterium]|nr:Txe/YoeB family addiction module toxin [Candidatus Peregrinibacteria bacterium]MCB9807905.1 Txe/YoeB family addiction module toxin [Candidatus Peribacteria bacterium]
MKYKLVYTKQAVEDAKKLKTSPLAKKAVSLLQQLSENPFASPPVFETLVGDLSGAYSRRLNQQHRIVYQVYKKQKVVKILRLWTHYE